MTTSNFVDEVWAEFGSDKPFEPFVHYDRDGDCLEFIAVNEAFLGERIDKWVTVYRGRESGAIVGSVIKDVKKLLEANPGLRIEILSGPVRLSHFMMAPKFDATSEPALRVYQEIIDKADDLDVGPELACAVK